jgi:hypothetical protein
MTLYLRKYYSLLILLLPVFLTFGCGIKNTENASKIIESQLRKSCPIPSIFDDKKSPGIMLKGVMSIEGLENYVDITIHDINNKEEEDLLIARIKKIVNSQDIRCKVKIEFYEKGVITVEKDKLKNGRIHTSKREEIISDYPYRKEFINP